MATVTITNDHYTVNPLYQWDVNQTLQIYGLSLPVVPEIHFTNEAMDRAIVRQAKTDDAGVITVDVPNSLLQKPYRITAYICIYEGNTFKSLYKIGITVITRKKPADYTLTDDPEVYSFTALENLIAKTTKDLTDKYNDVISVVSKSNANTVTEVEAIRDEAINTINKKADETLNNIGETTEKADTALNIAKGKNRAHVFNTTDDLYAWLSDQKNIGLYQVGDNLYIIDTGVPDWWISEVLAEADPETGFYYKIAQLETQKVDLTEITSAINNLETDLSSLIVVEKKSVDNVSIPADTATDGVQMSASKEGYTPIGLVGHAISNASENGLNPSSVTLVKSRIINGTTVSMQLRNFANTTARVMVDAFVLYVKTL